MQRTEDREKFDAMLEASPVASGRRTPQPFTPEQEESSFMSMMTTTMPGRAG